MRCEVDEREEEGRGGACRVREQCQRRRSEGDQLAAGSGRTGVAVDSGGSSC